jgi:hypothetical protein
MDQIYVDVFCFILFFENQLHTQPKKLLAPSNQAHWQRVGKNFICALVGIVK